MSTWFDSQFLSSIWIINTIYCWLVAVRMELSLYAIALAIVTIQTIYTEKRLYTSHWVLGIAHLLILNLILRYCKNHAHWYTLSMWNTRNIRVLSRASLHSISCIQLSFLQKNYHRERERERLPNVCFFFLLLLLLVNSQNIRPSQQKNIKTSLE